MNIFRSVHTHHIIIEYITHGEHAKGGRLSKAGNKVKPFRY